MCAASFMYSMCGKHNVYSMCIKHVKLSVMHVCAACYLYSKKIKTSCIQCVGRSKLDLLQYTYNTL